MNRNALSKLLLFVSLALIVGLALISFSARPLCAQVDTGAILGTVTDSSGAPVTGATVTLTNTGTGAALSTATGTDGTYKFSPVRVGTYKMSATLKGFETLTQLEVSVNIGQNVVVNFSLKPGKVRKPSRSPLLLPYCNRKTLPSAKSSIRAALMIFPSTDGILLSWPSLLRASTPPKLTRAVTPRAAPSPPMVLRPAQNNYLLDGIDNNSDTWTS